MHATEEVRMEIMINDNNTKKKTEGKFGNEIGIRKDANIQYESTVNNK